MFNRTRFGWKYATHTFSDFTKAIKLKTNGFNRHGWLPKGEDLHRDNWCRESMRLGVHDALPLHMKKKASASWMDFLTLAYVDDVWAHTFKDMNRTEKLAAIARIAGFLLLGYN